MGKVMRRLLLLLGLFLLFPGCAHQQALDAHSPQDKIDLPQQDDSDWTDVSVRRYCKSRNISGGELETLRQWVSGIKYQPLPDGDEPPVDEPAMDLDRYDFTFPIEGGESGFSYLYLDEKEAYLFLDGAWYSVTNPESPPVEP